MKLKTILSIIVATLSRALPRTGCFLAAFLLAIGLPMLVQAQFSFETNNGAITITGYKPAAGLNAVIPAVTNGYPVTSIGGDAFEFNAVTNVTIPNSVTNIGQYAFEGCGLRDHRQQCHQHRGLCV
jgi:BspA type Leucine rich repeat region (6 copies)